MRKVSLVILISTFAFSLFTSAALATWINPIGGGGKEQSLQQIFDGLVVSSPVGVSGYVAFGEPNDALADNVDSYWQISGSGASAATIVIEIAGYAGINKFGVYDDSNPANRVMIFDGAAGAGFQAFLSMKADGSIWVNNADSGIDFSVPTFGYYLQNSEGIFYSDTALNSDGFDHMVAFQGNDVLTVQLPGLVAGVWSDNEYILAWEDVTGGGDRDFNDFVLMVESVNPAPVPEPATMLLLGSGLIGLAGFGRKKLLKKS